MANFKVIQEELRVFGKELVDKVGELLHEGNVRRIIIKDAKGNTFIEVPVAVAAIGAIAAPILAAVGALAALMVNFTIVVERVKEEGHTETPPSDAKPAA